MIGLEGLQHVDILHKTLETTLSKDYFLEFPDKYIRPI